MPFLLSAAVPVAAQPFTFEYLRSDLGRMAYGTVAWADANQDGRLDLLMTGSLQPGAPYQLGAKLFLAQASGTISVGGNVFPFSSQASGPRDT